MKLYYAPGACSLADHIALVESGLPFEAESVDLKSKFTESGANYADINPKGYVPALQLKVGDILTENIAILSYIADRSGKLMPQGDLGRFRALEALAYISTELHKSFKPFFTPDASDAEKDRARNMLTKRLSLFDNELSENSYALGSDFTVADCYLFVMLFWARTKIGLDLPPALSAYYDRLFNYAAVRKALEAEKLV
jgi:glutathione S-transferase